MSTESLCVNTIRAVSADQPEAASSGHPGAPMGCAPMAYVLWGEVMKYSAKDPEWINRDRFVLSNGHACALQYTMLHLTGYNVSTEDLMQFRKLHSKTPGHPEVFCTDGKEEELYHLCIGVPVYRVSFFFVQNRCRSLYGSFGTRNLQCGWIGGRRTPHGGSIQ